MEGIYDSSLTFGASLKLQRLNTERSYKRQGHATLKHFVGFFVQWWKAEITVA